MAENDDTADVPGGDPTPTHPVVPPEASAAAPAAPTEATAPTEPILKSRWRDRAWSFRAMLAVALATFLIGGLAGATIVAVADDDHGGARMHRTGPWGPGGKLPPGWRHRFDDGGPPWRWNDGQPPGGQVTPQSPAPTPSPSTPSPSQ